MTIDVNEIKGNKNTENSANDDQVMQEVEDWNEKSPRENNNHQINLNIYKESEPNQKKFEKIAGNDDGKVITII